MTTNLVLPTLTHWTEQHVSQLIQATDDASFDAAFDDFVSANAKIIINGTDTSRDNYKAFLQGENFEESGATVSFTGVVEVPADQSDTFHAGAVGLFYTAIITRKIRVRGAPTQSQVTSSLNVIIERDPAIATPPPSPIHGFFDPRRVMVLNQVILNGIVSQTEAA